MGVKDIASADFLYTLPPERIAAYPLKERDASRILISDGNNIAADKFANLPALIPQNSLFVFNDTRVVHARLIFHKDSGAGIEIFLLEPFSPLTEMQMAFQQHSPMTWKCLVGNSRRWKSDTLEMTFRRNGKEHTLKATRESRQEAYSLVRFDWAPAEVPFAEILEFFGKVPLPPYIHREAEADDDIRYQTVFARYEGSVAAPTAGLHFTESIMERLRKDGHTLAYLTLHVGAGTFKPVSSDTIGEHEMHREQIVVSKDLIQQLIAHQGKLIAVGTTSVRSLESIFWLGAKLLAGDKNISVLDQWEVYGFEKVPDRQEALSALLDYLETNNKKSISASTQLIILPGYEYKLVDAMITNFHQPGSTLLMLVAAWLGDAWRDAYAYALANDFRFLSYGDSCLFLK